MGSNLWPSLQFKQNSSIALVDPDVNPMRRFCKEENETFHNFVTNCPGLRQVGLDNIRYFTPYDWKVNKLLQYSFTPEINDYLERKDYLVNGNLQYLDLNYSTNDSS